VSSGRKAGLVESEAGLLMVPNTHPGKLIVMEGIEGAGKTTQLTLLQNWLEAQGYAVNYTRRRTSKLVAKAIERAKATKSLTPVTYSLIHAADFADILENEIIPALKAGIIVIADRYVFTSFARDVVRGNERNWVRKLYSFATAPDALIYLDVPIHVSFARTPPQRIQEFYDAGLDTGLHPDPAECFKLFHSKIRDEFTNHMLHEFGFFILDGTEPIHVVQHKLRDYVKQLLG